MLHGAASKELVQHDPGYLQWYVGNIVNALYGGSSNNEQGCGWSGGIDVVLKCFIAAMEGNAATADSASVPQP